MAYFFFFFGISFAITCVDNEFTPNWITPWRLTLKRH